MANPTYPVSLSARSCHGRFCSTEIGGFPNNTQCKNLSSFVSQNFDSSSQVPSTSCCKIYCNISNAVLDALQCQGASESAAIYIWLCLMSVMVLAFLHLLGGIWPGLSRKIGITTMGNLALTGLTSYFLVTFSGGSSDTILYPIVAAMDFAIFSYFFSGFQYSIGIGTEAASVVLLSFTIIPLYRILAVPESVIPGLINSDSSSDPHAHAIRGEALVMLSLALIWALHSAVYRTISYRAHWIAAWNEQTGKTQKTRGDGKHNMRKLWFLAAGQGHPTWHTSVGRSVGFLMLILAWIIVVQCRLYLEQTCRDDFILFQIMLYVPPVLLTLAILWTEIYVLRFACVDSGIGGKPTQGFWNVLERIFLLDKGPSPDDFVKATIAYKLGRNSLYVEQEFDKLGFEGPFDKHIGHTVCNLQLGLGLLFYIPNVIIKSFNVCIFPLLGILEECFLLKKRERPSPSEKDQAYETLIKCCGPTDNIPKREVKPDEKQKIIEAILEKDLKLVNLPLLLDMSGVSALLYLLNILDEKLAATTSLHELQTDVNPQYPCA